MASALTEDRVRSDITLLARAGLPTGEFLAEAYASLGRALPHAGACVATTDPETCLATGIYKFGSLAGRDDGDREFGILEYQRPEPTSFVELARRGVLAVAMHVETGGDVTRSARMGEFMLPRFGITDELRIRASDRGRTWGGFSLVRCAEPPFGAADVEFAATLAPVLGTGLRSSVLAHLACVATAGPGVDKGPCVVVVGPDVQIRRTSAGAADRLAALAHDARSADPVNILGGLVAGARRFAAGQSEDLPSTRVQAADGRWSVLRASPLSGPGDEVVITIEAARPPEIVTLVVAAFGLTGREHDVIHLVLQGNATREIAAALDVSAWTVQDHLKSVFAKAGVRSRRELVARVFFEQYAPRLGSSVGPDGWFTDA